ncbi:MAG TPA: hypothetical protein VNB06_17000 [Thermoanaerobaculia bacterium]|nr:hypothetical protein [Thermoanaerobaculia bacterium]
MSSRLRALLLAGVAGLALSAPVATASEVKIFRISGAAAYASGTLESTSLDALGILRLAQSYERVVTLEAPYLLAAARAGDGFVLGTGNDGEVLRVVPGARGGLERLLDAEEAQISALWVDPDGTIWAASSPDGKVYRIDADGTTEAVFAPGERYIWALARDARGRLLIGTGTQGKLFALEPGKSEGEVVLDVSDAHIRSLLPRPDGSVLVGTAGEGLVLRLGGDGKAVTLHDAPQPEITAFAAAPDGTVYAAALASEGSFVDLQASTSTARSTERDSSSGDAARITVDAGAAVAAGSRPSSYTGPRSELLRISEAGVVETVWRFERETVYSLLWQERLWIGTGMDGKLYSLLDGTLLLERDVDELQIVQLLPGETAPAFATTNGSALYRAVGARERTGSFTSAVLDAEQPSRFGSLHWRGELPRGAEVAFQLRSGSSPNPDATWSEWSEPLQGRDVSLADVPRGRYLQWQAELSAGGEASPTIEAVEISYLQQNRRPEIKSLEVLEPGKILVPSNFNPGQQAFEPAHPNRDGIFTTLGGPAADDAQRSKELWKLGYRTLKWEATDPNGDPLRYDLHVRQQDEERWLEVATELEDSWLSFDSTVLPDGYYRFRLTVTDAKANLAEEALTAERISDLVIVDHGAPRLDGVTRAGDHYEIAVSDELSPLREAMVSVDGKAWRPIEAADGLVDSRSERLLLDVPADATVVLLRLRDAAFNVITFDLTPRLKDARR